MPKYEYNLKGLLQCLEDCRDGWAVLAETGARTKREVSHFEGCEELCPACEFVGEIFKFNFRAYASTCDFCPFLGSCVCGEVCHRPHSFYHEWRFAVDEDTRKYYASKISQEAASRAGAVREAIRRMEARGEIVP